MKKIILSVLLLSLVLMAKAEVPTGAVDGVFSISETQKVYFSQGNLIYNGDGSWSFAEYQYDVPGEQGLFAWGTSEYGNPDTIPAGRGIRFAAVGGTSLYANFDWGVYNPISNGGNIPGLWRTLTSEEWKYLLDKHENEWTTIEGQSGLKVKADDGVNFIFLPAAGQIGVGGTNISEANTAGYYWASTSVGDYEKSAEAYKLTETNNELEGNANRLQKMSVRLVYDTQAWLTVSDREDNSTMLAGYKPEQGNPLKGLPMNVRVIRSLTPNMSNTLTLPFDVEEGEMADIFGDGYELWQLDEANTGSIDVEAQAFDVNLVKATSIEAGVPYLITPTQPVNNMHFNNRVIKKSSNDECVAGTKSDLVQFCGLLDKTHLTAGDKSCLFLYPNNTLVWSAENDNSSMNSLRAYFKVNATSPSSVPLRNFAPRMIVTSPSVTTELGYRKQATGYRKVMKDGQLMIVRDTIVLNLWGQRIK